MRFMAVLTAAAIAFISVLTLGCSMDQGFMPYSSASDSQNGRQTTDGRDGQKNLPSLRLYTTDQSMVVPDRIGLYERYMSEHAGVSLDVVYLPHAQYLEQLNLKFAGSEFPDVYQSWAGPDPDLIQAGKVLALNDLIDQYGPNMKKSIPQKAWDAVTVDGRIYAIPQLSETLQGSVFYIRKDWLDKLGLEIPRNSDELLEVMRAFRDKDPNGNGLHDEIPFTMREKLSWAENLIGMWGVNSRYTETYYQGELILGSVHPNFALSLDYLRTMFQEKLLDRDFLLNTLSIWDQKISSGLVGVWNHSPRSAWDWQKELDQNIPDQHPDVVAMLTPQGAGYEGPVGNKWSPIIKTYTIMANAADPIAIIRYFDWLFSEEGRQFTELGIEGETFRREGDAIKITEGRAADIDFLQEVFAIHPIGAKSEAVILNEPRALEKLKAAYDTANAQGFVSETIGMPNIGNDYNLHSLLVEEAALTIVGEKSPDDYLDFVSNWRKNGGQQLIDERTAWYREFRLKS